MFMHVCVFTNSLSIQLIFTERLLYMDCAAHLCVEETDKTQAHQ